MQRLKTRAQFEAAMAGRTISRTAHFVLHRAASDAPAEQAAGPEGSKPRALFALSEASVGAVVPKRWAKRAVTRNGIKRQIYTLIASFEDRLPCAAHVVRLRVGFARERFPSAWSDTLKAEVRSELQALFSKAVIPAKAGIQGSPAIGLGPRLRGSDE